MKRLQDLFQLYPYIDLSKGMSTCGDSCKIYIDILQTYAAEPQTDMLNTYYEQKDAPNYQIQIHGIKSASLSVGFSRLAEQALALENAAREADWDYIESHHSAFLKEYQQAIDAIKKAMPD